MTKLSQSSTPVSFTSLIKIFSLILPDRADAVANHSSTSGPLILDIDLVASAQAWAQHMADTNNFTRSGTLGQGEFIGISYEGGSIAEMIPYLASGKEYYHGEILPNGTLEYYEEYTQMVWPSTLSLGLGSAKASNGYVYVCGRYEPEGNVFGEAAWGPGGTAKQT